MWSLFANLECETIWSKVIFQLWNTKTKCPFRFFHWKSKSLEILYNCIRHKWSVKDLIWFSCKQNPRDIYWSNLTAANRSNMSWNVSKRPLKWNEKACRRPPFPRSWNWWYWACAMQYMAIILSSISFCTELEANGGMSGVRHTIQLVKVEKLQKSPTDHLCNALTSALCHAEVNRRIRWTGQIFVKFQGGHKPGKHGKPGELRKFEKLSNSQGKLKEIWIIV